MVSAISISWGAARRLFFQGGFFPLVLRDKRCKYSFIYPPTAPVLLSAASTEPPSNGRSERWSLVGSHMLRATPSAPFSVRVWSDSTEAACHDFLRRPSKINRAAQAIKRTYCRSESEILRELHKIFGVLSAFFRLTPGLCNFIGSLTGANDFPDRVAIILS
jgi:hypothetical protein